MKRLLLALAAAACIFCSCEKNDDPASTNEDNTSPPVVHYEFANSLNDQSGNNFHGIADTAVDFVPDRFSRGNQAIRFNGPLHNSFFSMPALGGKQVNDSFSVSFWFTITTAGSTNLLYKADMANGAESAQTILTSNGKLRVILGDGLTSTRELDGNTSLAANTWYHFVLTVKTLNDIKIYLNGSLYNNQMAASGQAQNFAFKNNKATAAGLLGGKSPLPLTDGKLDDFRLYKRALSATEVLALYNYQP